MNCLKYGVQILLLWFSLFSMMKAGAQENVYGKYKVGERVLCEPFYNGQFKPGTVVEVVGAGDALTCCMYRIKIDNDNDPLWKDGRTISGRNIKPIGTPKEPTTANPNRNTTKEIKRNEQVNTGPTEDFNQLADRKIMDCPIPQNQVKANAAPNQVLLKQLIQCLFERKAPQGLTGAKTMDITSFRIGTPRKWIPRNDIGSGNPNTNVYPIKVSWTEKTYYETFTQQIDNISIFNCYVNAVGEWECGLGQRINESEIKRIPRN